MANDTTTNEPKDGKDNLTVAIILPCLFAVILVILLVIAFLTPRIMREDGPEAKEERRKKRLAELEDNVKAQHFVDWAKKQRKEHPGAPLPAELTHPLCVICLDEIEDAAQIRGLGCFHVFHQTCLDDWFSRGNEYCPLCHRPIVQNAKRIQKRTRTGELPETNVAFLA